MHEVRLPVFEGPLDLLLQLIERQDLDITAVSLVAVTDQYLAAIHGEDQVDPYALADFVAIGARLIYLKSRALLPRLPGEPEPALEDDDVGRELVEMLAEYRRFREVVDVLQERQAAGYRLFPRLAPAPPIPPGPGLDQVTVDALYGIMLEVLERLPAMPQGVVQRERYTLAERVASFRERLRRYGRFSFRKAMARARDRREVVVAFLAILELLKSGDCDARQSAAWGDIEIVAVAAAKAAG